MSAAMQEDPIEFKPSFGGLSLNVNELLRRWRSKPEPTAVVSRRFLQVFQQHGIQPTQIQRFLPEITLDKLDSATALLGSLSNEVLEQTAQLFGVRREWLEGVDDLIYPYRSCYKAPRQFFEDLSSLHLGNDPFPVRAIHSGEGLDAASGQSQTLALVLVEQVGLLGEDDIFRYRVYADHWDWSYAPCRIQLKAMVRVFNLRTRSPVPLYRVAESELLNILERRRIPHEALRDCLLTEPSLEDYSLAFGNDIAAGQSLQAKEVKELPAVLDYIAPFELELARLESAHAAPS